jgi:glycolate oxidase
VAAMRPKALEKDLSEIVGRERVTTDPFETSFYTADFVPVPRQIKRFFDTVPSAVVKPATMEDVARVLAYCHGARLSLTVRGGGSSGLFGSVPKKGGIVLDTTGLTRLVGIDGERGCVTVEAGMTWWELDSHLRKAGMTLKSYPSSARSATIAGWIMGAGLGIGSLAHGAVFDHLEECELVLSDGSVRNVARGRGLEHFCASEGVLGVLTRVTLDTRPVPAAASYHLFSSDRIDGILELAEELAQAEPRPFAIELFDGRYMSLLRQAGEEVAPVAQGGGVLLAAYEGSTRHVEEGSQIARRKASSFGAGDDQGGEAEWARRFTMMKVRRSVPSLILGSAYVPLEHIRSFYSRVAKISKRPVAVLAHIISEKDAMVMPMFVTNERNVPNYLLALRLPHEVSEIALSLGGKPGGGIGVWNSPYLNRVFPRQKIDEMRGRKRELDPHSILNPGMWFDPPFFLRPRVHAMGMAAARILDRMLPA